MKKIFLLALLLVGTAFAYAQYSVTGKVVDSKGNPVLGAKVTDPKTGVSTVTGVDGSFILNSSTNISKVGVAYVGYNSETKRAQDGMVIKLGSTSWWSSKAESFWYVGAQALFPERHFDTVIPGIEVGWVKKFGAYAKGFFLPDKNAEYASRLSQYDYWFTGKRYVGWRGFTAGFIMHLHCPIYFYLGAGYSERAVQYQLHNGDWITDDALDWENNWMLEAGLKFKYKKLMINAGTIVNMGELYDHDLDNNERFMVNVGINYCF